MTSFTLNKAPQNSVFRPDPQDVLKYAILSAFILLFILKISAQSEPRWLVTGDCTKQSPTFLPADTTVTAPCNYVWMGIDRFSEYYLANMQYQRLQTLVPIYQLTVDSLQTTNQTIMLQYDSIIAYQNMMLSNRLESIALLHQQNRTLKKQVTRNKLFTGSLGIGLVTIILIAL